MIAGVSSSGAGFAFGASGFAAGFADADIGAEKRLEAKSGAIIEKIPFVILGKWRYNIRDIVHKRSRRFK